MVLLYTTMPGQNEEELETQEPTKEENETEEEQQQEQESGYEKYEDRVMGAIIGVTEADP